MSIDTFPRATAATMAVAVHRRSTGQDESIAVAVRALAHVAWHRDIAGDGTASGNRWTVSYLPTGQAITAGIRTRAHAVSLARYLESRRGVLAHRAA